MIIVRLQGGMGNQMFQYACGRALSVKNQTGLLLDTSLLLDRTPRKGFTFREYDLDVFNIQSGIVSTKKAPWKLLLQKLLRRILRPAGSERQFNFDPAILKLGPDTVLDGYWQSPRYFSAIEETIRKDFTLKTPLPESSQALLGEISGISSVALHVRRGDYVGHSYHEVGIDQSYYDRALDYIHERQPIQKVYVFSDDIAWCEEHLRFQFETVYVGQEYAGKKGEGHMMLMSNCRNFVIPNSSFSWWAAWLATSPDKIVIAPKKWFADPGINTSDLIPAEWVRI